MADSDNRLEDINTNSTISESNDPDKPSYFIDVEDKKNPFSSFVKTIVDKIKPKTQKLLGDGSLQKVPRTNKSIAFMWTMGHFRNSLIDAVSNVVNKISEIFPKNSIPNNTMYTEVLGKNQPESKPPEEKEPYNPPIIPAPTKSPLKVEGINTSAIPSNKLEEYAPKETILNPPPNKTKKFDPER